MTNRYLKIVIGGDTVPTKSNEMYLKNQKEDVVFNEIKSVFTSSDIVIVNLECPLTAHDVQLKKFGPCLKAEPETLNGLLNAGINVFSLANNHIMDYGPTGLQETISLIESKKAIVVGAGKNLDNARKILTLQKNGYKISVISVAEHEFSIAREDYPGANPFDPFDTLDDIRKSSHEADFIIVLYHGGIEHYRYPSPSLQKSCRKMIESGADVVICQHSHCIGAYENYENGHIVYGQGNLLFDYPTNNQMWKEELLVELIFEDDKFNIRFIPVIKKDFSINLAKGDDLDNIIIPFQERSAKLADKDFIKNEWIAFCETKKYLYIYTSLNFGYVLRKLDRALGYILSNSILRSKKFLKLYNFLFCEAHADVQKTIFDLSYRNNWK